VPPGKGGDGRGCRRLRRVRAAGGLVGGADGPVDAERGIGLAAEDRVALGAGGGDDVLAAGGDAGRDVELVDEGGAADQAGRALDARVERGAAGGGGKVEVAVLDGDGARRRKERGAVTRRVVSRRRRARRRG
jgi:hypothetical protein